MRKICCILAISGMTLLTGCNKKDPSPLKVIDGEANSYNTVQIGDQLWMAENLKATKFNDGTAIPLVLTDGAWEELSSPAYCWYSNDEISYRNVYGALYNGYAVSSGKLCPAGWHIPSKQEWQQLRAFLGDSSKAGGALKESGTLHWLAPNKGASNSSGFTALGTGFRYNEGTFASLLSYTGIWAETQSGEETKDSDEWFAGLYYGNSSFVIDRRSRNQGFSVRCIKDN